MALRFAMLGAGFWSRFQLAGWRDLEGVTCVAICDPALDKAQARAAEFGIPAVYDSAESLFEQEQIDFIDIVTPVETHRPLVELAASYGLNIICQKPMGVDLAEAEQMVRACEDAGVQLLINENWRWQYPIRQFKRYLDTGNIGTPFRARIHYVSSFPFYINQPSLKDLEQFILADMGSHLLDAARFLFGEAHSLYCQTYRVHSDIKGEDVATLMLNMGANITVTCEISYASRTEIERFPETYIYVEGSRGFLELGPDFWIRETTENGTLSSRHKPPRYTWADPMYDVVHSSIPACQANLLTALNGTGQAETTGADNLKTCQLYFGAYESAAKNQVLRFDS